MKTEIGETFDSNRVWCFAFRFGKLCSSPGMITDWQRGTCNRQGRSLVLFACVLIISSWLNHRRSDLKFSYFYRDTEIFCLRSFDNRKFMNGGSILSQAVASTDGLDHRWRHSIELVHHKYVFMQLVSFPGTDPTFFGVWEGGKLNNIVKILHILSIRTRESEISGDHLLRKMEKSRKNFNFRPEKVSYRGFDTWT